MNFSSELSALLKRDLSTLARHVQAFPTNELLWQTVPGVANSAGNLILHLEGNLREYVGRQLGGIAYTRDRPSEFTVGALTASQLVHRVEHLNEVIPSVVGAISPSQLAMPYN